MNNNFYVYIWTRLDKNEVFYVGKGSKNRYKDMRMRNRYFLNIVNKIGIDNIKIDIIENNLTEEQAFQKEIFYINYYKKQGCNLTNISKGGEGSSGWFDSLSDEEKEKHREISKSFLGKHHTEETRNKMSKSAKGRKMSEETKKKISLSNIGRKGTTNKIVYVIINNKIIKIYNSKKECIKDKNKIGVSEYYIEKSLKKYKNINYELNKRYGDVIIIFKEDYDRLETQSTIESVNIEKYNIE